MSDKFAKLFDTKYGQILVLRQGAEVDDGEENLGDEVRVFMQPDGLGVCSIAAKFKDTESGYYMLTGISIGVGVGINDSLFSYDRVFDDYTFADGLPFGVKVEE